MSAGSQKAVIDRIVDGIHAVLIVGEAEQQYIVPADQLPKGAGAGVWLQVRFAGDTLVEADVDAEQTAQVHAGISEKMDQLRKRGRRLSQG